MKISKTEFIIKLLKIPNKVKHLWFTRYNKWYFKLHKVKMGVNPLIRNKVYLKITTPGTLEIGDNFVFTSGDAINPLSRNSNGVIFISKNGYVKIGDNVQMSTPVIWCNESVCIGDNVKIGGDVVIMDTDAHNLNFVARRNRVTDQACVHNAPIKIEEDVLIGTRSIILKGVTIGARTIIGSGSIVTKDIPSDCIAAGNPCRVIKNIK